TVASWSSRPTPTSARKRGSRYVSSADGSPTRRTGSRDSIVIMTTTLRIGACTLTLEQGDITAVDVDAIVNAANHSLLGGGGVDGAIHRKGGPAVLAACRELRTTAWPDGLATGRAVITTAGKLPARHVIHTVGPVYSGNPDVPRLLAACHESSL